MASWAAQAPCFLVFASLFSGNYSLFAFRAKGTKRAGKSGFSFEIRISRGLNFPNFPVISLINRDLRGSRVSPALGTQPLFP